MLVKHIDIDYMKNMARESLYPVRKLISLSEEQAQRVADYRFDARLKSENEAIRELIDRGLEASDDRRTTSEGRETP